MKPPGEITWCSWKLGFSSEQAVSSVISLERQCVTEKSNPKNNGKMCKNYTFCFTVL